MWEVEAFLGTASRRRYWGFGVGVWVALKWHVVVHLYHRALVTVLWVSAYTGWTQNWHYFVTGVHSIRDGLHSSWLSSI